MNKLVLSLSLVMGLSASAQTQTTTTPNAGSTTTTVEAVKPEAAKKWSASVWLNNSKGIDKAVNSSHLLYLTGGYKVAPSWTISTTARWSYEYRTRTGVDTGEQANATFLNQRINFINSGLEFAGAKATMLYRLTLPTAKNQRPAHAMFYGSVNPNLTWDMGKGMSIAYDGSLAGSFTKYGESETMDALKSNQYMLINAATLGYDINEGFGVYQKVGHAYTLRNSAKDGSGRTGLNVLGSYADIETGMSYKVSKNISIGADVTQSTMLAEGSSVGHLYVTSDGVYRPNYMLYRPEETSYEVSVTASF